MTVLAVILSLCFTAAIVPPAASLAPRRETINSNVGVLCATCDPTFTICSDRLYERCSRGYLCGSVFTLNIGEEHGLTVVRRCMHPYECGRTSSISTKNSHLLKVTSCCNTDDCTPPDNEFQQMRNEFGFSGLTCPSCSAFGFTDCVPSETVLCSGRENMCFYRTTVEQGRTSGVTGFSSSSRGCATKSRCDQGNYTRLYVNLAIEEKMICTKPKNYSQCVFC